MRLREFVKQFIAPNSIIRLWKKTNDNHGYEMIVGDKLDGVFMSWEIDQIVSYANKYADCEVLYIKDILNETYPESINIVIKCE